MLQALIELEAAQHDRRRPLRAHRRAAPPTATAPASAAALDQGRRRRAAHPQAARGLVLPVAAGAAPAHRPGAVGGGDGGLRARGLHPQGRRPGQGPGHRRRASPESEVAASVASSTARSARSASGRWTTPPSRTCSWTPPTSRPTRAPRWSSRAVVIATGVRADGGREVLGLGRRRQRGRRLLDGLPALAAGPRPGRRASWSISDAHEGLKGAIGAGDRGRGLAALPGPLPAQRAGPGPQGLGRDGRRGHPHDLRPARRGRRRRAARQGRRPSSAPASRPSRRCCSRRART